MKIFVTAIGGDIGYGVIKALRQSHYDVNIIGCDINKYNYSLDVVDSFYVCPAYSDENNWLAFVLNVLSNTKADYFWPITEPEIKIVQKNREKFADVKVIINQDMVIDISTDKGRTAEALREAGVETPKTWSEVSVCLTENRKKYPLIVKEKFGCGSHGVKIVNSREELLEVYDCMQDPIIQEYIGNADEEYTMAVFSDGSVVNSIAFRRKLGFGGMSRSVELIHDNQIYEIAEKIAGYLNLIGSINVQMRRVDSTYYVFEINPRISSTIGFRVQLGFNDVEWWVDLLNNQKVEKYTVTDRKVYGIRNVEEKLFFES